jgi:hypothetical protein
MPTKGRNHAHRYDNMKRVAESQVHFKPTNHQIVLGENMYMQFLSFFIYLFITVQSVIIIIYTAIQIIRVIIIVLFCEVSTSRFY